MEKNGNCLFDNKLNEYISINKEVSSICIIIVGMAGTGKTTFAKWLSQELRIPFFSKDKIKEQIYDSLNDNLEYEQKRKIGQASYKVLYGIMEELMTNNCNFIIESNFNQNASEIINDLKEKYQYNIKVIKFKCEYHTLNKRFLEREKSLDRHEGLRANLI